MPIAPPEVPPRYDPVFVTEDDLEDLSSFTGLSKQQCLERLRSYSTEEMADAWRQASPRTDADALAFYESTDLYIWELMQWHASPARLPYWKALTRLADRVDPASSSRVLDFGCGVGTDALYLASKGYSLTLVDVEGPAFNFTRHRFERRGWPAQFEVSTSSLPMPSGMFDAVVSFDVFEHLPDPVRAAGILAAHLRAGGLMAQNGEFSNDGDHPCHLHEGVHRYGGGRWYAELANLGLKGLGNMLFVKTEGPSRLIQRTRYFGWRTTGLWLEHL